MKTIGVLSNGNLIVEYTTKELSELISSLEKKLHSESWDEKEKELQAWSQRFAPKIRGLDINDRVKNILIRSISIDYEEYRLDEEKKSVSQPCEPFIRAHWAYEQDGHLMEFDEWCKSVIEEPERLWSIRHIGDKSQALILEALKNYG